MACCGQNGPPLLTELKDLVNQIGDGGCSDKQPCSCCVDPCCIPCCDFPFAQVVMTCPPPIMAPTRPEPVKPLQLPCPPCCSNEMTPEEAEATRYDNFYNNYNIDWHNDSPSWKNNCNTSCCTPAKRQGQTVDGKSPCCDECPKPNNDCCPLPGCPTGFKPCTMKLFPPPCCHPCGVWCAEIQPCPPKPKKKNRSCCSG